jgi:hypothetical protein
MIGTVTASFMDGHKGVTWRQVVRSLLVFDFCRGCRNTVFNASAQSGLYYLPSLAAAGYGTLRIELVNEPAEFVKPLLDTYRRVLEGRQKTREAWRWLQDHCAGGVAAGSLEVKGERAVSSLRPSARRT